MQSLPTLRNGSSSKAHSIVASVNVIGWFLSFCRVVLAATGGSPSPGNPAQTEIDHDQHYPLHQR